MSRQETIERTMTLLCAGERAIEVRDHESGRVVWLPLSQIEHSPADEDRGDIRVTLPLWLAVEKEIV